MRRFTSICASPYQLMAQFAVSSQACSSQRYLTAMEGRHTERTAPKSELSSTRDNVTEMRINFTHSRL